MRVVSEAQTLAGRIQNLVAHANAAVRTLITVEIHIEILLFSALGIQVFPVLFQIVAVDMLAGLDIAGGQADMLTVLDNGLALGNVARQPACDKW